MLIFYTAKKEMEEAYVQDVGDAVLWICSG